MSSDNGVYVLVTIRNRRMEGCASVKSEPYKVYRIAYAQAIDNLEYYKEEQPYNVGCYLKEIWGNSIVYHSQQEALLEAHKLAAKFDYLEYGVKTIETEYKMYGD